MIQQIDNVGEFVDKGFTWVLAEGYPQTDFFGAHNTLHYHHFSPNIDWITDFAKSTFSKFSITLIKQMPGMAIPQHVDKFYHFLSLHGLSDGVKIFRANIFLEDWKSGHYFEAGEKPIVKWRAGQYCILDNTVLHRSGNLGDVPKYTAQVTGIKL